MQKPWLKWLLVLLAVIGVGVVVRVLLAMRELNILARTVDIVTVNLVFAWCYYGLYRCRDRIWARSQRGFLIFTHLSWALSYIFLLVGRTSWASNLFGIWSLVAIGLAGVWLLNHLVSGGHPIIGVARVVVQQATRQHAFKFVIAGTVLLIVLLPGWLDPKERLNYRVSFFIVWALRIATVKLSILTALLACHTICYDQSRKQMFMIAVKPIGRLQYLLGKWLGLALLNLVLCAIVGVGIWLGARVMANEPLPNPPTVAAMRNKVITDNDVLAARVTASAEPGRETDLIAMRQAEFEELKRQYPGSYDKIEDLDSKTMGELQGKVIARWHTVEPMATRTYVFRGFKPLADQFKAWATQRQDLITRYTQLMKEQRVGEAEQVAREVDALEPPSMSLRLRMKPKYTSSSKDNMLRLRLRFGRQEVPLDPMADDTVREVQVPLSQVEEDGSVTVGIWNMDRDNPAGTHQANIVFKPYEGIEILYTAGTFEGNLVRGMVIHWVRLCFLAVLSLAAGTFLGFPMACLVSFLVYGIAVFSSFASESLDAYASFSVRDKSKWEVLLTVLQGIWNGIITGDVGAVLSLIVKLIGDTAVAVVPSFTYYNSTPLLADGRMVSFGLVGETLLFVGVIWGGVCLLIGWLLFRRKELARVTV